MLDTLPKITANSTGQNVDELLTLWLKMTLQQFKLAAWQGFLVKFSYFNSELAKI